MTYLQMALIIHWTAVANRLKYESAALITECPGKRPHWEYNDAYHEWERMRWLIETAHSGLLRRYAYAVALDTVSP